jgi:hypothetical protein
VLGNPAAVCTFFAACQPFTPVAPGQSRGTRFVFVRASRPLPARLK